MKCLWYRLIGACSVGLILISGRLLEEIRYLVIASTLTHTILMDLCNRGWIFNIKHPEFWHINFSRKDY
jgi:hypothetical protein